jgi:hypothetical protein
VNERQANDKEETENSSLNAESEQKLLVVIVSGVIPWIK